MTAPFNDPDVPADFLAAWKTFLGDKVVPIPHFHSAPPTGRVELSCRCALHPGTTVGMERPWL